MVLATLTKINKKSIITLLNKKIKLPKSKSHRLILTKWNQILAFKKFYERMQTVHITYAYLLTELGTIHYVIPKKKKKKRFKRSILVNLFMGSIL